MLAVDILTYGIPGLRWKFRFCRLCKIGFHWRIPRSKHDCTWSHFLWRSLRQFAICDILSHRISLLSEAHISLFTHRPDECFVLSCSLSLHPQPSNCSHSVSHKCVIGVCSWVGLVLARNIHSRQFYIRLKLPKVNIAASWDSSIIIWLIWHLRVQQRYFFWKV